MNPPYPHGLDAIRQAFGDISIRRHDGTGAWEVATRQWEARNMTKAIIPGFPRIVYIHRDFQDPLTRAMTRAVGSGVVGSGAYLIRAVSTFAPRPKRVVSSGSMVEVLASSGLLSLHSWGLAVDINPDQNPLLGRQDPPPVGTFRDIPDELIHIMEAEGLTCGWRFPRPDTMHFQLPSGY